MAKQGVVNIHGKQYKTVALRVNEFRKDHPAFGLETELVQNTDLVIMKALIKDESGRVIATGYAEEKRNSTNINKTSALENCETSAIGRALAAFGLAGEEYASADEVANAINQQQSSSPQATDEDKPWYNEDLFKEHTGYILEQKGKNLTPEQIIKEMRETYKVANKYLQMIKDL